MNIIQENNLSLKITAFCVIAGLVYLSGFGFYTQHLNNSGSYLMPSLVLILAIGLFYMQSWSRIFIVLGIWCFILGFYVNPFSFDDMSRSNQGYTVTAHLIKFAPYTVLGLWVMHIIGKYKQRFHFWPFKYSHNE